MTLHIDKVYAKFRDIAESIERLKAFKAVSLEAFLEDRDKQDIASFRVIVAAEAAIDLCLHISAKKLGKVADEYAACLKLPAASCGESSTVRKLNNFSIRSLTPQQATGNALADAVQNAGRSRAD